MILAMKAKVKFGLGLKEQKHKKRKNSERRLIYLKEKLIKVIRNI